MATKSQRKQQFPINNQTYCNPAHSYFKPAASQCSTLHFNSYDEPKLTSSGGGDDGNMFPGQTELGNFLTVEDLYNNFSHNHTSYPTTKNIMKNFSDFNGRQMSKQALKYLRYSKTVNMLGNAGGVLTVAGSAYKISKGKGTGWDWADGIVGIAGLGNSLALKYELIATPVIGEAVAIYFAARLLGTQFYKNTLRMTNYYMEHNINPGMQFIYFKE